MLEIPVNQAHLMGPMICVPTRFNVRDFVCELFTIQAFILRPVRPIGALDAGAAAGRGRQTRRRRCGGCGRGARRQPRRRSARWPRRGIRALGRRRCRIARAGRTAPGGGLDQRHQRRWHFETGRARGRDGEGRTRRQICRSRRSFTPGTRVRRSRSARSHGSLDLRTRTPRRRSGSRGACGQGRDAIRRRVGIERHRRHGAGDLDRVPRLVSAIEPGHLDDRDIRRRHRHGARLRLHVGAACLRSRRARKRRPQGGRTHGGARQSAQGRDLQGAGGVRSAGLGIAGRPSRRRRQRRLDRAQDQFPERPHGRATVRQKHPHHRRSPAGARIAFADLRCRRRHGEEARDHRRGRADLVAAGHRDRARTRTGHDRPCASRRVVVARRRDRTICTWRRASRRRPN